MLIATFLSLFVVPVLYIVINLIRDRLKPGGRNRSKAKQQAQVTSEVPTEELAQGGQRRE
jgi:HAE1 family hydrophobic/amphiphilic exporter-1